MISKSLIRLFKQKKMIIKVTIVVYTYNNYKVYITFKNIDKIYRNLTE